MDTFPITVSTRRLLAAGLLVLALVALALRHARPGPHSAALAVAPIRVAPAASARSRAAPGVVVDVEGAVRRPGLVHLSPGSRVADAVARAGGTTRLADRSGVNLAAPVSDGQQVVVPRRGAVGSAPPAAGSAAATSGPVSLSSASAEQLDALPGVGPVTAQKIVDYRTQHGAFHSVDELDAIPGIGPARLADLRGLVVP
ncbi:MAG TPA: ComEA family DNA-binding protein [Gaiellaceae bacterium]|nr:ComEA family DNA-binding protein [Gaiellaceae bacterium]